MKFLASAITLLLLVGTVAAGLYIGLDADGWMNLIQSIGTMAALVWIVDTAWSQAQATNRQTVLQSLELITPGLEELMKSIEVQIDKMGQNTGKYAEAFNSGERTAYVQLLTAENGKRLRRIVRVSSKEDQLLRRLRTYITMFEPVRNLAEKDPELRGIIGTSAYGRVYLAVRAALAENEDIAKPFITELAAHATGPFTAQSGGATDSPLQNY